MFEKDVIVPCREKNKYKDWGCDETQGFEAHEETPEVLVFYLLLKHLDFGYVGMVTNLFIKDSFREHYF